MKKTNLFYWISTCLLCLLFLMSAFMYFFQYEEIVKSFTALKFPIYLIIPLGIAKFLGVIFILYKKIKILTLLAYAGFFYNSILAISAHINVCDGEAWGGMMALAFVILSYVFYHKKYAN